MRIQDIITETTTGSVATMVTTLGDQRELHRSIYSSDSRKKLKKQSRMIRRVSEKEYKKLGNIQ